METSTLFSSRDAPRLAKAFLRLPAPERLLVARCVFLLPAIRIALRVVRMPILQRVLNTSSWGKACPSETFALEYGKNVARLVRAVARHGFYSANCLERSLTLWYLLRREGIAAEMFLGVRKRDHALEAHAWVEYSGTLLDEEDELVPQLTRFDEPLLFSPAIANDD